MSTRQYLNNLIEESYSLFTRIKSGVRKAGLVALVGTIIGVDVYGYKKEEPVREDTAPIESVEQNSTALKQLDRVIEWELNEGNKNFGIIAADFVKVVERGTLPKNASSVHAPLVYKENDIYCMLYGGQPKPNIRDNKGAYDAYNRYIFAAKSTDGINWSDHRLLFAVPNGEQVLHGPCSIIKKGDKYYYWYDRWYQNHWATHLAVGHGKNIYDCKWDFSPNMVFSSRLAQNNCSYSVAIHPKVLKKDNTYGSVNSFL